MKNHVLLIIAAFLMIASCSAPPKDEAQKTTQPSLDSLLKQYHEERLKLYPMDATMAGDNRYNDLLPNTLTDEFRQQVKSFYSGYRDKLTAFDRAALSENDQMSYDILLWECDITLEGL